MTWEEFNNLEKNKKYYIDLMSFIDNEYKNKTIFPEYSNIFKAFVYTPLEKVKVVIIGQDPYQTLGYATGLAFSVNKDCIIPRSLNNIFKELNNELGIKIPNNGSLDKWAKNGILLLNRILTVEKDKSLSHKNIGWEEYTLNVIKLLNSLDKKIVYILLGNEAIKLKEYLNNPNQLVLTTSHPSPLSCNKGFFNSGIFINTCKFLNESSSLWEL